VRGCPGAHAKETSGGGRRPGLRWAWAGLAAGPERTWVEARWVGPSGSAQLDRIGFVFFEFIFNAKTIPEKSSSCFKAPKILGKFQTIYEKIPETLWDMSNPNKIFGAHEKDSRSL
jgi:hypothetical protein